MLRTIARQLRTLEPDVVAYRLHGDEFALIVSGDDEAAERHVRHSAALISIVGAEYGATLSASFGIARSGPGASEADLRKGADLLSLTAKTAGKSRIAFADARIIELHADPSRSGSG
jgi:GGDEF domain-containing protein